MPITHIVEEKDGLLVLSYSDRFRTDRALKNWKRVEPLSIHYRWGRPDAVGTYPSVRGVHPPLRRGEPYIFATVADGYVTTDGAKSIPHGIPGQLGLSSAYQVEDSSEGILVFDRDSREPPWRFGAKGWEVTSFSPSFEIDPGNNAADFEADSKEWDESRVLIGPGGAIFSVNGSGASPGTRTTGRFVAGKAERLGRETSGLNPSSSFITADGTLWNSSFEDLQRFEGGEWNVVLHVPRSDEAPSGRGLPSRLKPINKQGSPWFLLDSSDKDLWRLDPGSRDRQPSLARVEIRERKKPLKITAAIPWSDGTLLLATDGGLRIYDPVARILSKVDFQEPTRPVMALARDGLGRLWIGTDRGLRMREAGGKSLEIFDSVPLVWDQPVYSLAADPSHEDGIIAALGSRGVAFIQAPARP